MLFSKLAAATVAAFFSAQALAAPVVDASNTTTLAAIEKVAAEATDKGQFWSLPALSDEEYKAILQSSNPATNAIHDLERRGNANMCGHSTFYKGTGAPAYGYNCLDLAGILRNSNKVYIVPTAKGWHRIAAMASCEFGIRNDSPRGTNFIGSDDISDLIINSFDKFGVYLNGSKSRWLTRLSAKGRATCYAGQEVIWGITSTF